MAERKPSKQTLAQRARTKPSRKAQLLHGESTAADESSPVWERLSEALTRVIAAGLSGAEARILICEAIAKREVRFRWRGFTDDQVLSRLPAETATLYRNGLRQDPVRWQGLLEQLYPRQSMGETLDLGSPIEPDDFDWRESRFKAQLRFGSIAAPRPAYVWIDIFRADVTRVLCDGKGTGYMHTGMPGGEARSRQLRQWRAARIVRFAERQRREREWINFAEIAEWCSELDGSIISNEEARSSAYEKLLNDLLAGEFDENGRSRVLFLHSWTNMAKMTPSRARDFVDMSSPESLRSQYLDHCWIPRSLFQRWQATHNLPVEPPRFEPMQGGSSAPRLKAKGELPSRRGPAPGTVDRYREVDQVLYPELERIMLNHHKSTYAAAFELAEANKVQGSGTADSRAKRLAQRFKRDRSGKHTR